MVQCSSQSAVSHCVAVHDDACGCQLDPHHLHDDGEPVPHHHHQVWRKKMVHFARLQKSTCWEWEEFLDRSGGTVLSMFKKSLNLSVLSMFKKFLNRSFPLSGCTWQVPDQTINNSSIFTRGSSCSSMILKTNHNSTLFLFSGSSTCLLPPTSIPWSL